METFNRRWMSMSTRPNRRSSSAMNRRSFVLYMGRCNRRWTHPVSAHPSLLIRGQTPLLQQRPSRSLYLTDSRCQSSSRPSLSPRAMSVLQKGRCRNGQSQHEHCTIQWQRPLCQPVPRQYRRHLSRYPYPKKSRPRLQNYRQNRGG